MLRKLTISAKAKPDLKLDVQVLPPKCDDPAFVMSLNDKPGILALAMEEKEGKLEALPFIVPGARFNEKYGWDSVSFFFIQHGGCSLQYFMALGLLVDGKYDMVKSIVAHCMFEIKHYNKVLNGNRSYVSTPQQKKLLLIPLVSRSIPASLLDGLGSPILQSA